MQAYRWIWQGSHSFTLCPKWHAPSFIESSQFHCWFPQWWANWKNLHRIACWKVHMEGRMFSNTFAEVDWSQCCHWAHSFTLHFALSNQIKSNPPQDVDIIGVNDKGQLGDHILVSGMIPVSLWSSQFWIYIYIYINHTMMSRAIMKVAMVEVVPCNCSSEFCDLYGPNIRRIHQVVVDKR